MRLALVAVAVGVVAVARDDAWQLAAPAPVVAIEPGVVPALDTYACATCHTEVAAEWAATAHGLAWVDATYQDSLKTKRRPKSCHGCHIPEPLLAGVLPRRPKPRADDRHLGVSCEACHVGPAGEMLGPRGTPVDAHASAASEYMQTPGSDALCIVCHATSIGPVIGVAKGFSAEDGPSCVECHMARIERKWADGEDVPVRMGRSHALQTPRDPSFLRRAFDLVLTESKGRARVVISNRAGHRVPGLIGRELRFHAALLDAEGEVLEEVDLLIDERGYLPAHGTSELRFKQSGASVHIVGDHLDPRSKTPVRFLDERLLR